MGVRPRDFVFVCLCGSGSLTGSTHDEIFGARNHILEVRLESLEGVRCGLPFDVLCFEG
jgi:hypothetical protein